MQTPEATKEKPDGAEGRRVRRPDSQSWEVMLGSLHVWTALRGVARLCSDEGYQYSQAYFINRIADRK